MKKLLLICLMVFAMNTVAFAATETISTAKELIEFSQRTDYDADDTYTLKTDITISEDDDWEGIGCNEEFQGVFDGGGNVITFENCEVGLFDDAYRATIKNITIEGTIIAESSNSVGGLVNTWEGAGYIYGLFNSVNSAQNCVNAATVINEGSGGVGGLIGTVNGTLDVIECATISEKLIDEGGGSVGGLIGTWNKSNGWLEISDSYVITTVEAKDEDKVLGFVGTTSSSFWINSSTNESTSYCCMFLDEGNEYSLIEDLSPSGSYDEYCKIVSDPSVAKEDYDGYSDAVWLHVENAFPRLEGNNPYNLSQIMAAIAPIVDTSEDVITVRNIYDGTWSYDGSELADGEKIEISKGDYLTLGIDGVERDYPILNTGDYTIDIVSSRESTINSVAEYDGISRYTYEIQEEDGKSSFTNAAIDEIDLDCDADETVFDASINDSIVTLEIDLDRDVNTELEIHAGDTLKGSVYFYDEITLAVGEIAFSVSVNAIGELSVQFYDSDVYYCTTDVVPVNYDVVSSGYGGSVEITYKDAESQEATTVEGNGADVDGGAPRYAGTYEYVAIFANEDGYEGIEKTGTYTIDTVPLTETLKYSNSSDYNANDFIYDGNQIEDIEYTDLTGELAKLLEYGDYYKWDGNAYEANGDADAPTDAGTYKRVATVDEEGEHYIGSGAGSTQSVVFTITQQTVNAVVSGDFFEYVYNEAQSPEFTLYYGTGDDAEYYNDYTVTYYEDETCEKEVSGIPSEPGDYWYTITLNDANNFNLGIVQNAEGKVLAQEECYFTIGDYKVVKVDVSQTAITWTGETKEPALDLTVEDGIDVTNDDFEIVYYEEHDEIGEDLPLAEIPTDAGTYLFEITYGAGYTVTFTGNATGTGTGEFVIAQQEVNVNVSSVSYEWDGTGKSGLYQVTDALGASMELLDSSEINVEYLEDGKQLEVKPSQVGAYTYICWVEDETGNQKFIYTDTAVSIGSLSITDRSDWSKSLIFEQGVAYEMISLGESESWQDQYGVIYNSAVPFFVEETIELYLTKVEG